MLQDVSSAGRSHGLQGVAVWDVNQHIAVITKMTTLPEWAIGVSSGLIVRKRSTPTAPGANRSFCYDSPPLESAIPTSGPLIGVVTFSANIPSPLARPKGGRHATLGWRSSHALWRHRLEQNTGGRPLPLGRIRLPSTGQIWVMPGIDFRFMAPILAL